MRGSVLAAATAMAWSVTPELVTKKSYYIVT